jgi:hypothetical protein
MGIFTKNLSSLFLRLWIKMPEFRLTIRPSAYAAFALLWLAAGLVFSLVFDAPTIDAILAGLGTAILHWVGLLIHHSGHAWAARRTGYPSSGLRLWWWLGASLYPKDETDLSPSIHIRRALGGPIAGALMGSLSGLLAVVLRAAGFNVWLLAAFLAADCLLIYTIGSLLPLGFTDGSTILRWRQRSRAGSNKA